MLKTSSNDPKRYPEYPEYKFSINASTILIASTKIYYFYGFTNDGVHTRPPPQTTPLSSPKLSKSFEYLGCDHVFWATDTITAILGMKSTEGGINMKGMPLSDENIVPGVIWNLESSAGWYFLVASRDPPDATRQSHIPGLKHCTTTYVGSSFPILDKEWSVYNSLLTYTPQTLKVFSECIFPSELYHLLSRCDKLNYCFHSTNDLIWFEVTINAYTSHSLIQTVAEPCLPSLNDRSSSIDHSRPSLPSLHPRLLVNTNTTLKGMPSTFWCFSSFLHINIEGLEFLLNNFKCWTHPRINHWNSCHQHMTRIGLIK